MKHWVALLLLLAMVGLAGASTQSEFELWLETDATDEHEYNNGTYMCIQFADDLIVNATGAGHDVRMVGIDYPGG
jgi:hypothetical protein